MGIPAKADTQDNIEEAAKETEEATKKFESAVTDVVKQITRGKDGKYILPEGISPEVKYAAILEQRRRDTQSEFTKVAQTNKAISIENNVLKQKISGEVKLELTKEQAEELEDLKFSDPEAWRKKITKLENDAIAKRNEDIKAEVGKVSKETLDKDEIERRKEILDGFIQDHPGFKLDDTILANDIPPRFLKKLETGQISFETFLEEVYEYSITGKVIKQDETLDQPNLGKVGGGSKPDKNAQKEDIITSYNKEIF